MPPPQTNLKGSLVPLRALTCLRTHFVQQFDHAFTLLVGPHSNWRATSNLFVLFLDFWSSTLRYPRGQAALKRIIGGYRGP